MKLHRLKKKEKRELKRITEYMISGGAFFWTGYAVFFLIDKVLHAGFAWAKIVSTLLGWTVNYLLQRFWVFNNPKLKKHQTETTNRYIILTLANFVIDYFLVLGLRNWFGLSPYIGIFLSAGFFTVWNYLWYKYWVFPDKYPTKKRLKGAATLARAAK